MPKTTIAAAAALAGMAALVAGGPAGATTKHHRHHHVVMRAPAIVAAPQAETPYSFYPNEIDGGVSGNLPFNNQLRKLKDPLNANGAGR